ncbi:MAG: hypothetical protein IJG07_08320 [Prevotella sp.]|nr:hypothetical protein [Prevotella sp.]
MNRYFKHLVDTEAPPVSLLCPCYRSTYSKISFVCARFLRTIGAQANMFLGSKRALYLVNTSEEFRFLYWSNRMVVVGVAILHADNQFNCVVHAL